MQGAASRRVTCSPALASRPAAARPPRPPPTKTADLIFVLYPREYRASPTLLSHVLGGPCHHIAHFWYASLVQRPGIYLPKLFGKSECAPNRAPGGVQEGTKGSRSAASWRQRRTLEKSPAIFQTVSPRAEVKSR